MGGRCTKPETDAEGGGGAVGPGSKRAESSGAAARQSADGVRGADPGSPSSHRGSRRASVDGPSGRGGASSGPGGGGGASSSFRSLGGASSASYSSMPGVHPGVPAPFSFAGGDGRASSAGGGHGPGARGSIGGGSRGARGMTAAEAEISRLRACVKEAEGKLVEERLMFGAILEEERENARRLRERARRESESGAGTSRPPVIHTSNGALLDRRYLAGMTSADGAAVHGDGRSSAAQLAAAAVDVDGVAVDVESNSLAGTSLER